MTTDEVERADNGSDDCPECPLCMEPLDLDDINFYPCTCGYQVCKFCWHRMRTDENGLCPACRQKYPDDPVEFRPIATEAMQRFKSKKQQQQRVGQKQRKDGGNKEKPGDRIIDSRKHLATIRVVQKNLVFVIGLPGKLTDPEVLKRPDYFGKFGRILKVMVNVLNANGTPASSASAYITYVRADDALRAIKALNNFHMEGRVLKASLGTTKYCVNFLKNTPCSKPECMYLHDLGDGAASFTKEEMQQGKHQEYEKQLLDAISATTVPSVAAPVNANANNVPAPAPPPITVEAPSSKPNAGSSEEAVVERGGNRRAATQPVPLQRDSSPSCSSSASLSSSSGSLKSSSQSCESSSSQSHSPSEPSRSERNSPAVAFDLFGDTFEEFGFDPWNESSKGLADLMELESRSRGTSASVAVGGGMGSSPFGGGQGMGYSQMQQAYGYVGNHHAMEMSHTTAAAAYGMSAYEQQQQALYMQQQQHYRHRMMQLNRMEQQQQQPEMVRNQLGESANYGYGKWAAGADPGMMGYQRSAATQRPAYPDGGYVNHSSSSAAPQQSTTFYNRSAGMGAGAGAAAPAGGSQGAYPHYRLTVQ
ncbi:LOW QUALITY PROTEIN: CCR4-NOT transcription complex subunit 4-like [Paramacrobiotus metropolitanus]|uniref:LOW QUALITY PROTEIN: CCR4-NOT transcription complex subunit 4-like n=1 Tax=Paramacrobiotus metropolitanus TaxID=2943436 RepID=UPI0024460143|nr:LOW QUALITY PROTEIN: CCR4-NOT transcription complex subunit 4-like [Paramacrobiotus metropolitanus]